jgi:molybdopterin converting factor small subunit
MATTILIPTPLRAYTGKRDSVQVEGATIGEALRDLTRQFADLRQHLYTEQGALRNFVNVYVNDDDIRYLQKDATALKPGDVLVNGHASAGGVDRLRRG